jgi:glycosyltransferase involved in cell wall biosynthesis
MRLTLFRASPAEGWPSMDRYAASLAGALPAVLPADWELQMPMPPAALPWPYAQLLGRALCYPAWARRRAGDLNHILDHSYAHLLRALPAERTLVTVHDIAPLLFPGRRAGLSGLLWRQAWRAAQRACYIVTVSEYIAAQIRPLVGAQRIWVAPHGVAAHFRPLSAAAGAAARARYMPGNAPLLLHIGAVSPRKNLPALLHALSQVRRGGTPAVLLQVGGRPTPNILALIDALGLADAVRFAGKVAEEELPALYNAAAVFVFPSLYEGFGMPIVEAQACGTPVVAAKAASLPEVLGDAGLLADPHAPADLAEAIARVLNEPALGRSLSQRGVARAQAFTWERCARRYAEIYASIVGT